MKALLKKVPLLIGVCAVAAVAVALLWSAPRDGLDRDGDKQRRTPALFADPQSCIRCHDKEYRAWRGSHHDLAMQVAAADTVLGDFNDSVFTHFGVTSRFFHRDGAFFVNTEGPDGRMADFEIKYTFGVEWLQQYLVAFPGGRLQCLTIAWDTENRRWFHLYPDERITAEDPLHWTGLYQNWNMMCAECHSTNLRKGYDAATESYRSTWDEIDVGCQACHGPGSWHVERAERRDRGEHVAEEPLDGLTFSLNEPVPGAWVLDPETLKYKRTIPLSSNIESETCAPCHARRHGLVEEYLPGRPLLDSYVPARLRAPLYHPDGQILDEVYVYGSFVQSKMYHKGVRCRDCHDSHSLDLHYSPDSVCMSCHLSNVYDVAEHHFHKPDSKGALCVECHMPARTYMVLDPRRDHSIRIPRPDLSVKLGISDACSSCHDDKSVQWSADAAAKWYGPPDPDEKHYGEVLAAGREGAAGAENELAALAGDRERPAIVRATALDLLAGYGPAAVEGLSAAAGDENALVRIAAVAGMEQWAPENKLVVAAPLLADPVRAVRMEAARVMASVAPESLSPDQREAFEFALAEFERALTAVADSPGGNLNLGVLRAAQGRSKLAEQFYRRAIRLDPTFLPARFNLARLYNAEARNAEAEQVLTEGLSRAPKAPEGDKGELHYSLGLLMAEEERLDEAVEHLGEAARLLPERARVRRNYALALQHLGSRAEAVAELLAAHRMHEASPEIVEALAIFYMQEGLWDRALVFADKLVALAPQAPGPREMARRIRAEKARAAVK